jgi:4-hydroxybenzoate polyprenyltransferase
MNDSAGKDDYLALRLAAWRKWWRFTNERFSPASHLPMIAIFLAAHAIMAKQTGLLRADLGQILLIFIGTVAFFLKLRLFDEIKDYEVDLVKNPDRPLARGDVSHYDLKRRIERAVFIELLCFGIVNIKAAIALLFAIIYSFLMYKEFFIGKRIRPHLTTYATSHTVVTVFLSLAIFSGLTFRLPWEFRADYILFALMSWLLFNIFELGRKTYQPHEEREDVESYSLVWGRYGAVILVLGHSLLVIAIMRTIPQLSHSFSLTYQWLGLIPLGTAAIFYLIKPITFTGKIYRAMASIYIVIVYLGIVLQHFVRKW